MSYALNRISWMCEKCDKISDPKKVEDLLEEAKSSLASLNEGKHLFNLFECNILMQPFL